MRVQEPAARFHGLFRLPGDKSISHRAAILAAMADGRSVLRNFSSAADCASTLRCLQDLGVAIVRDGQTVTVTGTGTDGLRAPQRTLDAGNSGSTLRMLAGVLAGRPFRSVLDGDASLRRRPMERIASPLRMMGARVTSSDGRPPLAVEGGALRGIDYELPVASAQVKTAVLLAGLQAAGRTVVREPALSRDHTERLLPLFGVAVHRTALTAAVDGSARLRAAEVNVPGDPSSAAFLVTAALLVPDAHVRIEGVLLNPTRVAFLDVLVRMGGRITFGQDAAEPEPVGWIEARSSRLCGLEVAAAAVPSLIDEIPILAVAATQASGAFAVRGAEELRVKESDRIAVLAEELRRMGANVEEHRDGLTVHGGPRLRGSTVRAHGDHRIAMALTVAALVAEGPTTIAEAESASVSFPEFFAAMDAATGGRA